MSSDFRVNYVAAAKDVVLSRDLSHLGPGAPLACPLLSTPLVSSLYKMYFNLHCKLRQNRYYEQHAATQRYHHSGVTIRSSIRASVVSEGCEVVAVDLCEPSDLIGRYLGVGCSSTLRLVLRAVAPPGISRR